MKIQVRLAKDPADYAVNNPQKKIGMLLGARAGDIIWYYMTDDKKKGGLSIKPQDIGFCKYKEMLTATVEAALVILGYSSSDK